MFVIKDENGNLITIGPGTRIDKVTREQSYAIKVVVPAFFNCGPHEQDDFSLIATDLSDAVATSMLDELFDAMTQTLCYDVAPAVVNHMQRAGENPIVDEPKTCGNGCKKAATIAEGFEQADKAGPEGCKVEVPVNGDVDDVSTTS
jgi:hypothetical protein